MSTKSDYGAEEWKAITGAPVLSGLFITLADASGPVGIVKEAMAVGKAITDSAGAGNTPEIVKALAESVKNAGGRPELPDVPKGDRATMKTDVLGRIMNAVTTIQAKSPAEADAFKGWLVSIAVNVALASKEGGFLGLGGTLVSKDEQDALKTLAESLGVKPPQLQA
jgi:hypothetical protein